MGAGVSSITLGWGFTHDLGPSCDECGTIEARCAYTRGCCEDCTHFRQLAPGRRLLPVEHGTDRGYYQHRARIEPACAPCRAAHSVRVVKQRRAS